MHSPPRTGSSHQKTFCVEDVHVIQFDRTPVPPVLATPWLIWFMEETALELVLPHLDEGEMTVGTHVDIAHQSPAPAGHDVTCTARLIHVDGPVLSFQVEARDRHEVIARGAHKRRVVDAGRLAARVRKKAGQS